MPKNLPDHWADPTQWNSVVYIHCLCKLAYYTVLKGRWRLNLHKYCRNLTNCQIDDCPRRFSAIIGRNLSVPQSNHFHVVIFQRFSLLLWGMFYRFLSVRVVDFHAKVVPLTWYVGHCVGFNYYLEVGLTQVSVNHETLFVVCRVSSSWRLFIHEIF